MRKIHTLLNVHEHQTNCYNNCQKANYNQHFSEYTEGIKARIAKTEFCVFLAGWSTCWVVIGTSETSRTIDARVPLVWHLITAVGGPAAAHYSIGNVGRKVDGTGAYLPTAAGVAWDPVVTTIIVAVVGKVSPDVVGRVVICSLPL